MSDNDDTVVCTCCNAFIIVCRTVQHCLAHGEYDLQHVEQDTDAVARECVATAEDVVVALTDGNAQMVRIVSDTLQWNSLKQLLCTIIVTC